MYAVKKVRGQARENSHVKQGCVKSSWFQTYTVLCPRREGVDQLGSLRASGMDFLAPFEHGSDV
jgi:hypothetical protein